MKAMNDESESTRGSKYFVTDSAYLNVSIFLKTFICASIAHNLCSCDLVGETVNLPTASAEKV